MTTTTTESKLRRVIVGLSASNVKRLEAVELDGLGRVVEISGRNGAGKTSVLDAIALALEGRAKSVGEPIRVGQDKAHVTLDLGDIVVTRSWRRTDEDGNVTTSLRVESKKDCGKLAKPQQVLDELVSRVAFDPLRFANQRPKDRVDELLRVAGLEERLGELDARRRKLWDDRLEVGREARRLESAAGELPVPSSGLPADEVSVSELIGQVAEVEARQRRLDEKVGRVEACEQAAAGSLAHVRKLEAELEEARRQHERDLQEVERSKADAVAERDAQAADPRPTVAELRQRIEQAEATNAAVRDAQRRRKLEHEAKAAREDYARLSQEIEQLDAEKVDALARSPLPLPGLGLGEEDITLRGVPFGDLAASERLGVGITLALHADPGLRVCLIRDASLLDDDAWRYVVDMAHEQDFQVWLETVGEGRSPAAVVIEAGHVRATAGVAS